MVQALQSQLNQIVEKSDERETQHSKQVESLTEQLQEEIKSRYKVETILAKLMEDVLRLKGVTLTDEALEDHIRVATHFLETIDPAWKADFDEIDFGDLLGTGGFSEVYSGTYRGEMVAIKKLRVDVLQGDDYLEALEQEIELLSELKHENILKFIGFTDWPSYYILTEFMSKGTLRSVLFDLSTSLPWDTRCFITQQIVAALSYLHHVSEVCFIVLIFYFIHLF